MRIVVQHVTWRIGNTSRSTSPMTSRMLVGKVPNHVVLTVLEGEQNPLLSLRQGRKAN